MKMLNLYFFSFYLYTPSEQKISCLFWVCYKLRFFSFPRYITCEVHSAPLARTHKCTHTHTCRSCIWLRSPAGTAPWTRCTPDICGRVLSLTAASLAAVCSASCWRVKNLPSARRWGMRMTKKRWNHGEVSHHHPLVLLGQATAGTATPTASIESSRRTLTI